MAASATKKLEFVGKGRKKEDNFSQSCTSATVHFFLGTYNNQYMVLDLKKVELQKSLKDNALWIIEQIPG